jgi:hypothetical protein
MGSDEETTPAAAPSAPATRPTGPPATPEDERSTDKDWRRFNGAWWYADPDNPPKWKRLRPDDPDVPLRPPRLSWLERFSQSMESTSPLPPLLIGVTAALIALVLAITIFPSAPVTVLAPVLGVIGAFGGHAAGHAAAKHK